MVEKRILGLDVGDKTIGIAVTDPMGWTVQPVTTLQRKNLKQTLDDLFQFIQEYDIQEIVLGLPLDISGAEGPQAQKVRLFERQLHNFLQKKHCNLSVVAWDESFSTQEAEEVLIAADMSRKKRKNIVDKLAAQRILQSYLESLKK